jgi:hypothetical protein
MVFRLKELKDVIASQENNVTTAVTLRSIDDFSVYREYLNIGPRMDDMPRPFHLFDSLTRDLTGGSMQTYKKVLTGASIAGAMFWVIPQTTSRAVANPVATNGVYGLPNIVNTAIPFSIFPYHESVKPRIKQFYV